MQRIIDIKDGVPRQMAFSMKQPINLTFTNDEQIAIIGPNGGGKSVLIDILIQKHALLNNEVHYDFFPSKSNKVCENIKYVTFKDVSGDPTGATYYQQRWNQGDEYESPYIKDILNDNNTDDDIFRKKLYDLLQIESLLEKQLIMLSSGELRKFQLAKSLQRAPRVLIIDNPLIGLDTDARKLTMTFLQQIASINNILLILVVSRIEDIPSFITHIIHVEDMSIHPKETKEAYLKKSINVEKITGLDEEKKNAILNLSTKDNDYKAPEVLRFENIIIRYGKRTILKNLCWQVKCGEKWALTGENGSGKSTLLSLVCADNPQAYACDIALFGKKRGTGESIWDIKKHIGYVSPEIYRTYQKDLPTISIVASGLHDSIGLYKRSTPEDLKVCEWWMNIFGIGDIKDRPYLQLSNGEQRLVLLARAFVKDPELLILDEPFHGLDNRRRIMAKEIIETFCRRKNKTLIMVSHYMEEYPECISHQLKLKKTNN